MSDFWLYQGDCVEVLRQWPENSVDAVVCDPPYEIGFMAKEWDKAGVAFSPATWAEMLRVLKPGGHLLSFGGTRTYHRLACAIEDAGFEVRDSLMWLYGSGFPKSLNVQQAMNKAARGFPQGGADPESPNHGKFKGGVSAENSAGRGFGAGAGAFMAEQGAGRGDDAGPWKGWGTALKPAHEPIILARKPLDGTVAANVQKWGTGALNIDGCRISTTDKLVAGGPLGVNAGDTRTGKALGMFQEGTPNTFEQNPLGRWPANVMLDEEAAAELDAQSGISKSSGGAGVKSRGAMGKRVFGEYALDRNGQNAGGLGDTGGASRFFYVAKTSRRERDHGLEAFPARSGGEATDREDGTAGLNSPRAGAGRTGGAKNTHPTVKPVALMRELCRLVTPPGGIVLDPFVGSGSTGMAARLEGFRFIGVDLSAEYLAVAHARISAALSLK